MQTYKNLSSVIRQVVTEAHTKDHPPFTPDQKSSSFKKPDNKNRTDMDTVRALAHKARQTIQQKMRESFDLDITDEEADDLLEHILELDEVSVARLSSYVKNAPKSISKMLNTAAVHAKNATDLYDKGDAAASIDHENKVHKLHTKANNRDKFITLAAKKLKGMTEEESKEMKEYGYTAEQHKKRAAEHKENADAARKSGDEVDHHFHMRNFHDSMMKAAARMKPPTKGGFKSNEFPD